MMGVFVNGVDLSANGQALDAILTNEPGHALPRQRPHAGQLRERVLPRARSPTTTASSSGRRTAPSTRPSARTPSGSGSSPSTRRRRWTPPSTRRSSTSSPGRRRRCRTPKSDGRLLTRGLDAAAKAALAAALEDPIFEVLPLKNLPDQIPHLPAGALVSVTASPAKGIDATLDWAVRLHADGFRAIPHLSARMIADRAKLSELLDRAREAGLTRVFVVGGDADEPGEYLDGLSLLQAMTELGTRSRRSAAGAIRRATRTSPTPRSPRPSSTRRRTWRTSRPRWTSTRRRSRPGSTPGGRRGSRPHVIVGVPGVSDPQKLMSIAARIGVKDSKRFLMKNLRFVTGLAKIGRLLQADRVRRGDRAAARRSSGRRHRLPPVHVQRRRSHR